MSDKLTPDSVTESIQKLDGKVAVNRLEPIIPDDIDRLQNRIKELEAENAKLIADSEVIKALKETMFSSWSEMSEGLKGMATAEAHERIKELEAQLYIAKDSALRAYDGLADKADKYDVTKKKLDIAFEALKDIRWSWENDAGRACDEIARQALEEIEKLDK
jgi:uncharacterized coiled-coil protein SlyX